VLGDLNRNSDRGRRENMASLISAALTAETERCCKEMCRYCRDESVPVPKPVNENVWGHRVNGCDRYCEASPILRSFFQQQVYQKLALQPSRELKIHEL